MNRKMLHIILLGAPGCGKGSLSEQLAAHYHICHFSTGDMLRQAVQDKTPLGLQAAALIDAGHFVGDDIIMGLMREKLQTVRSDTEDRALTIVLYDGFPRTIPQAEAFDALLAETGEAVNSVIYMECPEDVLLYRTKNRCVCSDCSFVGSLPKVSVSEDGKRYCPRCGQLLKQRKDDSPEVFPERMNAFYKMTAPLVPYYSDTGKLVRVDSSKDTQILEKEDIDFFIDSLLADK